MWLSAYTGTSTHPCELAAIWFGHSTGCLGSHTTNTFTHSQGKPADNLMPQKRRWDIDYATTAIVTTKEKRTREEKTAGQPCPNAKNSGHSTARSVSHARTQ